ncbi:MAG: PP2C family protein-serine/threonine phosphatase [Thiobacillaceae bacterium]
MKALDILVVDDVLPNLDLLDQFLSQAGHRVIAANSGLQAVEMFRTHQPELVLMDVMLPDISGLEATRRIRALAAERWVPILYVSALHEREQVVQGLAAGGDDYLTKPVDLALLDAKIRAMQRIADMQSRLTDALHELKRYRDAAEQEQATAQAVMDMMIKSACTEEPGLSLWLEPAARFSGDLVIASRSRFGHLYVLQADSMGHGLTAALPLLPIAHIFRDMSERGICLPAIAHEMNAILQRQLPRGFFVCATLAAIDRRNRTVEVWNGGNPAALLVNEQGEVVRRFASNHLPLGILPPERFQADTCGWQVQSGQASLVLHSDGLIEARNPAGEPFGEARLLAALGQGDDRHEAVMAAVRDHLGGERGHDDISLISVDCQAR